MDHRGLPGRGVHRAQTAAGERGHQVHHAARGATLRILSRGPHRGRHRLRRRDLPAEQGELEAEKVKAEGQQEAVQSEISAGQKWEAKVAADKRHFASTKVGFSVQLLTCDHGTWYAKHQSHTLYTTLCLPMILFVIKDHYSNLSKLGQKPEATSIMRYFGNGLLPIYAEIIPYRDSFWSMNDFVYEVLRLL